MKSDHDCLIEKFFCRRTYSLDPFYQHYMAVWREEILKGLASEGEGLQKSYI